MDGGLGYVDFFILRLALAARRGLPKHHLHENRFDEAWVGVADDATDDVPGSGELRFKPACVCVHVGQFPCGVLPRLSVFPGCASDTAHVSIIARRYLGRHVNVEVVMTQSLFIQTGARMRLPSGARAVFVRWQSRHVNPDNRAEGLERIAVVQLEGGFGVSEFSESFMRRVKVLS